MRHDSHYVDQLTTTGATVPVRLVPIVEIDHKQAIDPRELTSLVESIRRLGVLQPLLVRPHDHRYELIAGNRRLAAATAAGLTTVPCLVHQVADGRAGELAVAASLRRPDQPLVSGSQGLPVTLIDEFSQAFDTMTSCLTLLRDRGRRLRERTALQLMRVEVQQALRLGGGLKVLAQTPARRRQDSRVQEVVGRALAALEPERRLLGLAVSVDAQGLAGPISGDPVLLELAVAGIVAAGLALLQDAEDGEVRVSVGAADVSKRVRLDVIQRPLTLPPDMLSRLFDLTWTERAGGYPAAVGLVAARRIAELHDGSLEVACVEGGCRFRLEVSAGEGSGELQPSVS